MKRTREQQVSKQNQGSEGNNFNSSISDDKGTFCNKMHHQFETNQRNRFSMHRTCDEREQHTVQRTESKRHSPSRGQSPKHKSTGTVRL